MDGIKNERNDDRRCTGNSVLAVFLSALEWRYE